MPSQVWLIGSDTHFAFADAAAVALFTQVAREIQPDGIAHLGDLLDAYQLSTFCKNPLTTAIFAEELRQARAFLEALSFIPQRMLWQPRCPLAKVPMDKGP